MLASSRRSRALPGVLATENAAIAAFEGACTTGSGQIQRNGRQTRQ